MSQTRGRVILIVHVPILSLASEGLMWPSQSIATAPTLNFNVTQQSLVLGMSGTAQSHDRNLTRDTPSAPKRPTCLVIHYLPPSHHILPADNSHF
ncbi:hypothetical protein EDB87DRAFT_1219000 [Lactarius vividus]|nr:hypothetical protein EDB87DRAFT_1219000 [Lactarius vividus]